MAEERDSSGLVDPASIPGLNADALARLDALLKKEPQPSPAEYVDQAKDHPLTQILKHLLGDDGFKTPEVGLLAICVIVGWLLIQDNQARSLSTLPGILLAVVKCVVAAGLIALALWSYGCLRDKPKAEAALRWMRFQKWGLALSFLATLVVGVVIGRFGCPLQPEPLEVQRRLRERVETSKQEYERAVKEYEATGSKIGSAGVRKDKRAGTSETSVIPKQTPRR